MAVDAMAVDAMAAVSYHIINIYLLPFFEKGHNRLFVILS